MDRFLFTAKVSPAKLFFRSLMVMKTMTDSASFAFMNGNIKLRALGNDAIAMLVMDSWAWSTDRSFYTSAGFAGNCNSWDWMSRLPPSLLQQEDRPLYFYVKRGSRNVHCLAEVGDDSRTENFDFCLGELFRQLPDNDSLDMDLRDVSLYLRSECLREVITSFAPRRESVMMVIFEKSVAWVTQVGVLRHHEEKNECRIVGGVRGSQSAHYTHVVWKGEGTLLLATELTEMVLIYAMADPRCRDWIAFKFIVDRDNYFRYAMRALEYQMEY